MADDITVKVGFDGTAAESGLGKLRKESDSFATQLTTRLAGAFGAMALFDRGVAFATKTFEKFADVSDKAERAGISAEDFQRIGYAAELSGTSMEVAAKAMREIRNATADAAAGSKKATEALLSLGFTQEEITKGEIKSTEVLLKMAQAYKAAGSDAAKFAIASSILSTRSASEMIPLLGTNQAELQRSMERDVISSDVANQMKVIADQTKLATQALEMFTVSLISGAARLYAKFEAVLGYEELKVASSLDDAQRYPEKRKQYEAEAMKNFEDYAQTMRIALLGTTVDGKFMDSSTVEGIINQKAFEMLPTDLANKRLAALESGKATTGQEPVATAGTNLGVVASSLAQVGGGGGVYASDAIDLAARTADATEQIAQTMEEWLAATYGGSVVTSE